MSFMKLWTGRFSKQTDSVTDDFNSSISFDSRMVREDTAGSIAHAAMLANQGIISQNDAKAIQSGLSDILADIESGKILIDMKSEDIHTFIESELTARIGDAGKRLHTGRSRNDQVALDLRLYIKNLVVPLRRQICDLIAVLCEMAEKHASTVMPGYTHLQRAQPITFGHHLMAYTEMFLRDIGRLDDATKRMDVSPLGSGALASTTYPLDRDAVAHSLGLSGVTHNSLDGVSDRDFAIEMAAAMSLVMVHLSRFSEEIILWSSWEFRFIELDDAFSTGSSIMPQKKNPDIAELVRGKSGRVFGDLMALLTVMKGLPLAYNKDMQEDKEAAFDAADTVKSCINVFIPMFDTITYNKERIREKLKEGFLNATDAADYLVGKGVAFRDAHEVIGNMVNYCIKNRKALEDLSLEEFKEFNSAFQPDIYEYIKMENCVIRRNTIGGPSPERVLEDIEKGKRFLGLI